MDRQESKFSTERISVEEWLQRLGAKFADVYQRRDKDGNTLLGSSGKPLFTLVTDKGQFAYVPSELGTKLANKEHTGRLFMTQVTTPGYREPMWMLCESKGVAHFTVD